MLGLQGAREAAAIAKTCVNSLAGSRPAIEQLSHPGRRVSRATDSALLRGTGKVGILDLTLNGRMMTAPQNALNSIRNWPAETTGSPP